MRAFFDALKGFYIKEKENSKPYIFQNRIIPYDKLHLMQRENAFKRAHKVSPGARNGIQNLQKIAGMTFGGIPARARHKEIDLKKAFANYPNGAK